MEQRYLADSNTIIDYVGNKMPQTALRTLDGYFNDSLNLSVITKVEVLGFNGNENEMKSLADFIALGIIFTVDNIIADKTIELRKLYAIKLPDAIIAATALVFNLTLLTRNTKDFKKITGLAVIDPHTL
jgi:predicted nucleic acid-binding protein